MPELCAARWCLKLVEGEEKELRMFEQAVLENAYGNRRAFATGAGFAGQAALAAFLIIAPMIWPQVLPKPRLSMTIGPPPPPPRPPDLVAAARPRPQHATTLFRPELLMPMRMPAHPQTIVDDPPPTGSPAEIGIEGGIGAGGSSDLLKQVLGSGEAPARPSKPLEAKPAPAAEVKPPRVSSLDPGKLIHFVEPIYPQIAKTAHISGSVELRAVIGTDGRVRSLEVIRGHSLLRGAAIDAVKQWVYKAPVLNGQNVELVAPIEVIFRMN
jgi:protein TonB